MSTYTEKSFVKPVFLDSGKAILQIKDNRILKSGLSGAKGLDIKWMPKAGNRMFSLTPTKKDLGSIDNKNGQIWIDVTENYESDQPNRKIELTWTKGMLRGEIFPPDDKKSEEMRDSVHEYLEKVNFPSTSNKKLKQKYGTGFNFNELMSMIFDNEIHPNEIYAVTASKKTNLPVRLTQKGKGKKKIGIGICNESVSESMLVKYCQDYEIIKLYEIGIVIISRVKGIFEISAMSSRGKIIPFKNAQKIFPNSIQKKLDDPYLEDVTSNPYLEAAVSLLPEMQDLTGLPAETVAKSVMELTNELEKQAVKKNE